ncbi:YwqJ-related putative deaminase [Yinghuangia aomiensis]
MPDTTKHPEPLPVRVPRDSILPAVAAALFVGKKVRTRAGHKGDLVPVAHPVVRDLLTELPSEQRERWTGRCPEVGAVVRAPLPKPRRCARAAPPRSPSLSPTHAAR